jgi:hypothetical protein
MEKSANTIDKSNTMVDSRDAVKHYFNCSEGSPLSLEGQEVRRDKDDAKINEIATNLDPDISDVNNPQNWPVWRKRTVFFALMTSSILCDGGMTWGASLFVAQAEEWHISLTRSSTSINWGILLQGFGGVLVVPLMEYCGRYLAFSSYSLNL